MGDFVPSAETSGARQGGEGPEEQRSLLFPQQHHRRGCQRDRSYRAARGGRR